MLVGTFEHQEAHWTVEGGEEEHGIGHGYMVGNEKRAATRRNALTSGNVQPVKRVRQHP